MSVEGVNSINAVTDPTSVSASAVELAMSVFRLPETARRMASSRSSSFPLARATSFISMAVIIQRYAICNSTGTFAHYGVLIPETARRERGSKKMPTLCIPRPYL